MTSSPLDVNNHLAATWYAAARPGYATPKQWRDWADRLIVTSGVPPMWLIKMSLARDFDELHEALLPRIEQENQDAGEMIAIGNATLGFHYLRYQRGDYTMREFLLKAGEEADGGVADLECEVVYQFLNELESMHEGEVAKVAKLDQQVARLFQPYKDTAEAEWSAVQSVVDG